jgi:hypothetical protein
VAAYAQWPAARQIAGGQSLLFLLQLPDFPAQLPILHKRLLVHFANLLNALI